MRLSVGGRSYDQPLTVKMDPRVSASQADLAEQLNMNLEISQALQRDFQAIAVLENVAAQLKALEPKANGELKDEIAALAKRVNEVEGGAEPGAPAAGLARLNEDMASLMGSIQTADHAPTTQAIAVFRIEQAELESKLAEWSRIKQDVAALSKKLAQQKLPAVSVP